jgi:hypothetical protein
MNAKTIKIIYCTGVSEYKKNSQNQMTLEVYLQSINQKIRF